MSWLCRLLGLASACVNEVTLALCADSLKIRRPKIAREMEPQQDFQESLGMMLGQIGQIRWAVFVQVHLEESTVTISLFDDVNSDIGTGLSMA